MSFNGQNSSQKIPLAFALSSLMLFLIITLGAVISFSTYFNTKKAIEELTGSLFKEIAHKVFKITDNHFNEVEKINNLNVKLTNNKLISPNNQKVMGIYLKQIINSYPLFMWACFSDKNGSFTGAFRDKDGKTYLQLTNIKENGTTIKEKYYVNRHNEWMLIEKNPYLKFDPRKRPYYQKVLNSKKSAWIKPYLFFGSKRPGTTFATPYYAKSGELEGVFTIDFELNFISTFLSQLTVGVSGKGQVFIITNRGELIAHSKPELVLSKTDKLILGSDCKDPVVKNAARVLKVSEKNRLSLQADRKKQFYYDNEYYIVVTHPLVLDKDLNWQIVIAVPEDDFLRKVKQNNIVTMIITACAFVMAIIGGILLSKKISLPLKRVSKEMEDIGNLVIESKPFVPSLIKEINIMNDSIERTKNSLKSFNKYVPSGLVRYLMTQGIEAELGGEKKNLTVFFSDLADFTAISEQLSPEKLVKYLGIYLEETSNIIQSYQGTVDKYIGDAIMAFWGAPNSVENHALSACKAALAYQELLDKIMREWKQMGRKNIFRARIGINTGEVIVGNIGSPTRLNYTVIGDSVNLASRLESINKLYGTRIIISESTNSLVQSELKSRILDYVAVKGKTRGVAVYELVGSENKIEDSQKYLIDTYSKAMDLYKKRDWENAVKLFKDCLETNPHDKASQVIIQKCREYQKTPPPENWDGVSVLKNK